MGKPSVLLVFWHPCRFSLTPTSKLCDAEALGIIRTFSMKSLIVCCLEESCSFNSQLIPHKPSTVKSLHLCCILSSAPFILTSHLDLCSPSSPATCYQWSVPAHNSCHICVPHHFISKVYQLLMATIECKGRSATKLRDHDIGRFEHIHLMLFYLLNILRHIVNASVSRFLRRKVGSASFNIFFGN